MKFSEFPKVTENGITHLPFKNSIFRFRALLFYENDIVEFICLKIEFTPDEDIFSKMIFLPEMDCDFILMNLEFFENVQYNKYMSSSNVNYDFIMPDEKRSIIQ